jgi:nucleoside 2-deoxyribosyltransferase
MKIMKDIFFTGTWRKEWNKEFNLTLERALIAKGFSCYLPQRDSDQTGSRKSIFLADIEGLKDAKVQLAIGANKAQSSNWGLEIGVAFTLGKPIIILTDKDSPPDLMPEGAASEIFVPEAIDDIESFMDDLEAVIRKYL